MLKSFTILVSCVVIFGNCNSQKNNPPNLFFTETYDQSSSLFLYKNYLAIVDTSFNDDGTIDSIKRFNYVFSNGVLKKTDGNDSELINESSKNAAIKNLANYYCVSDSIPYLVKKNIHSMGNIYELKDCSKYFIYLSRDSNGISFFGIYNKSKNKTNEVKISNSDDYSEMYLYDFDTDGISEILVFSNFYIHNHYLTKVNFFKVT